MRRRVAIAAVAGAVALGALAIVLGAARARAAGSDGAVELRVSAATTLRRAFQELAPEFEDASGIDVVFNFGASGALARQVEAGAPCDVFASAAPEQIDALATAGLISAEEIATFASNEIALIVPKGNPARVGSFRDLGRAERITTGNPDTAPHGRHALEVLTSLGTLDTLRHKLVFAENAGQTLAYVATGEVEAGIVFASEAESADAVEIVDAADASLHAPIRFVIAPVAGGAQPEYARAWIELVSSRAGQAVLAKYGFRPPPAEGAAR